MKVACLSWVGLSDELGVALVDCAVEAELDPTFDCLSPTSLILGQPERLDPEGGGGIGSELETGVVDDGTFCLVIPIVSDTRGPCATRVGSISSRIAVSLVCVASLVVVESATECRGTEPCVTI